MATSPHIDTAVAVVGSGPAGLTTAISFAKAEVPTVLIGGLAAPDRRTTALLAGSLAILENNGSWRHCAAKAAPLRQLRIVDDTGRLIRAPEVKFDATEIGLDAFGYNIENTELLVGLNERAQALPTLRRVDARLRSVEHAEDAVILHLDSGA
ncbi:MAG: FAD-dependent monooxygenase, partial [Pseudolabrys sp.]|nr:FAD-dependent monooxygenase [Pseudolabrys sp.]